MKRPVVKKVTSIHPLEGALGFITGIMKDSALGGDISGRSTAMTDEIGDITVDTCVPADTGVWETGILRESVEGKWVIVSQYESDEEAEEQHKRWVELMRNEPTCELKDINLWNIPEEED